MITFSGNITYWFIILLFFNQDVQFLLKNSQLLQRRKTRVNINEHNKMTPEIKGDGAVVGPAAAPHWLPWWTSTSPVLQLALPGQFPQLLVVLSWSLGLRLWQPPPNCMNKNTHTNTQPSSLLYFYVFFFVRWVKASPLTCEQMLPYTSYHRGKRTNGWLRDTVNG